MMTSTYIEMDKLAGRLPELIDEVSEGGEVVITKGDRPVARLVYYTPPRTKRHLGAAHGLVEIADDFDEPLSDFAEYAP